MTIRRILTLGKSGGAPQPYVAQGFHFDGASALGRDTAMTGVSDGKVGTFSCWLKLQTTDGMVAPVIYGYNGVNYHFRVTRLSSNKLIVTARNASNTTRITLQAATTTPFLNGAGWCHVHAAWDVGNALREIYVNGTNDTDAPSSSSDGVMDYSQPTWRIGSDAAGPPNRVTGDFADMYLNLAAAIFPSTDNTKFRSADGHPVDLGSDGSIPSGTAPAIFLAGADNSFGYVTQKGSGGSFPVIAGAITQSPDNP